MDILKAIRKQYYKNELRKFNKNDPYAHIGHFTSTPEEYELVKKRLDKEKEYLKNKIKENS